MARTYDYENGRKIVVHGGLDGSGMPCAEVIIGLTQLHRGTPYGCVCWLASNGDRRAAAQLQIWRQLQESRKCNGSSFR